MIDSASLKSDLLELSRYLDGPILGLDSSGPITSLCCVGLEQGVVDEREMDATALPSDTLAETISSLLRETKTQAENIKAIVVGIGPGSFTGIRVGLATAKGMALGAGIPLYGISSLGVLALSAQEPWVALCSDARHDEVYCALYRIDADGSLDSVVADGTRTQASFFSLISNAIGEHGIGRLRVVGDCAESFCAAHHFSIEVMGSDFCSPKMALAIRAMGKRLRDKKSDCITTLSPQYMRRTAAERNQK